MRIWDGETGAELWRFAGVDNEEFPAIAFSPNGNAVAFASSDPDDHNVRIWQFGGADNDPVLAQPDCRRRRHKMAIFACFARPDMIAKSTMWPIRQTAGYSASAQFNGHVFISNVENDVILRELRDPNTGAGLQTVNNLAWSPDSVRLVTVDAGGMTVWRVASGQVDRTIQSINDGRIFVAEFSPNGNFLATGDSKGYLQIWTVGSWQENMRFRAFEGSIASLAFSPDGTRIATKNEEAGIRVWDAATGARMLDINDDDNMHNINGLVFYTAPAAAGGGQRIAYGGTDGCIHVIDAIDGHEIRRFGNHDTDDLEYALPLVVSPNGSLFASAEDGKVHIWDANTGIEIRRFLDADDHNGFSTISFSPAGDAVAFGATDRVIRIWHFNAVALAPGRHVQRQVR